MCQSEVAKKKSELSEVIENFWNESEKKGKLIRVIEIKLDWII